MASALHSTFLDPTRPGKYPIQLGDDLLRDEKPRKRQRISLQCNHRPSSSSTQRALLKALPNGSHNEYELSMHDVDDKGKYIYRGQQRPISSLALIFDPEQRSFVLDRIDAEFYFNLTSAPTEKDPKTLAVKHPQLGIDGVEENGGNPSGTEANEDLETIPPDPDNPYDYRHYLKQGVNASPQRSLNASPVPNHTFHSSPLVQASSPTSRSRPLVETSRPKPHPKTKPRSKRTQRRDNFLSPHIRDEGNHTDELIIDMGDEAPKDKVRSWRKQLGVLNETRRDGPISLRSAASSMSPSVQPESDLEKNKSDDDVEEIDLGQSRLQGSRDDNGEAKNTVANGNGWDDEDDDIFAAELEQAMEQEAEKGQAQQQSHPPPTRVAESSSESEAD